MSIARNRTFSTTAVWLLFGGVAALAVVAFLPQAWTAGALFALAAVPGIVLLVPLLVLKTFDVEDGVAVGVAILLVLLGSLLSQLLLITVRLTSEVENERAKTTSQSRFMHRNA